MSAGETLKEGFGREIKEEIGIDIDYEKAELIDVIKFKLDKVKKDGIVFRDRAFSNVFAYLVEDDVSFNLDENEVSGIVRVNSKEVLDLFNGKVFKVNACIIDIQNNKLKREVSIKDFLINNGETAIDKYGQVLKFVINKTKN